jgi:hypothetical protein
MPADTSSWRMGAIIISGYILFSPQGSFLMILAEAATIPG